MNCRWEPISLECSEGLANVNSNKEPVCLRYSEGLVAVDSRGLSI